jgi:hypothetical protein
LDYIIFFKPLLYPLRDHFLRFNCSLIPSKPEDPEYANWWVYRWEISSLLGAVKMVVESGPDAKWQEWTDVPPARLYEVAQDNGVKIYTFPQSRLSVLTEEQAENIRADIVDMDGLRTRLEEAGWTTEPTDDNSLRVTKTGEE